MASIRERKRADGSMSYAVLWRDSDTGKQTSYPLPTRGEADNFKRLVEANGNSLDAVTAILKKITVAGPTLREHLAKHVDMLTKAGPDQIKRYRRAIDNHFSGRLGSIPVAAVEYEDIIVWLREMQSKGLKAKTIANHHGFLSAAMETAVRLKRRGDNPCRGVDLPKDDDVAEKMNFLTAAEANRVVQAHPERYRAFVRFLVATGARFGEATALQASDFDMTTNTFRISKAWKRAEDGSFYIGPPKTKKSRRTVSMPPLVADEVRPLLEDAKPSEWVFRTSCNGHIRHSTFHEFWTTALDSLGYPPSPGRPRIHDLRHTHASLMLAQGMSIFELSRRLGHEAISTTADRYSHLMPDAHFRAAAYAEKALTPVSDVVGEEFEPLGDDG